MKKSKKKILSLLSKHNREHGDCLCERFIIKSKKNKKIRKEHAVNVQRM